MSLQQHVQYYSNNKKAHRKVHHLWNNAIKFDRWQQHAMGRRRGGLLRLAALVFCGFYGRPISRYICSYSLPCALMSLDRAPWIYCDYCNSLLSCVRALQTDVVVIRDQSTNRERRPALFELDVQSHHATPVRSRDSVLPPHRLPVFRLTSYTLQATRITEMWTQRISTSTILTTTMTAITKQVAVDRPEHILVTAER